MSAVLQAAGHVVHASDLLPRADGVLKLDALSIPQATNLVTNPPYAALKLLVPHWLDTVEHKLALLVRLNFLEAQSRIPWLTGNNMPSDVIVCAGRMRVFGKTSQFPHCWVVWDKRRDCETRLIVDKP